MQENISGSYQVYSQNQRAKRIGAAGILTEVGWETALRANGRACVACGSPDDIVIDHVFPLSKGGCNTDDNVQPLCRSCNAAKGNRIIDIASLRQMIARRNGRKGGTAPNTSLVLTDDELARIARDPRHGGSKSAVVHAALTEYLRDV